MRSAYRYASTFISAKLYKHCAECTHRSAGNCTPPGREISQDQQEYISKVAKNTVDACALVDAGFEFVCDFEGDKNLQEKEVLTSKSKLTSLGWTPVLFYHGGAGGEIRTHVLLRDGILSPAHKAPYAH